MPSKKQVKTRDEKGVRILAYKRFEEGEDYIPVNTDEMVTMLEFEKHNFDRFIKSGGRPPVYETVSELQTEIKNYWDYLANANREDIRLIPDVEGLASFLGVSRETLNKWETVNYRGFADTIKMTKNTIAAFKKQLALHGKIPPIVFATDFNNNHGYVQKQEVTIEPKNAMNINSETAEEIAAKYSDPLALPGE